MDLIPTPSQTIGPFFHVNLTAEKHCISRIAGPEAKGERVWLSCRVYDGEGLPVNDAMIEIWQADADGRYNSQSGFGRLPTGTDGSCEFETIRPGRVPGADNVLQAPHLTVAIFARGLLKQLHTRVYFADDPANQHDPVLALVPQERRETLMAHPDPGKKGRWRFEIHLQGEQETVFFSV